MRNEDVRHATQQPPLSAIVKTLCLSLFGHIARMNELTDASRILFEPPSEVWRKPRGRPRNSWVRTVTNDLETPTLGFRKQERQLRTGSTGGCLRSIAQRTRSGACSYWIGYKIPCLFLLCIDLIYFNVLVLPLLSPEFNFGYCNLCYLQFYHCFNLKGMMLMFLVGCVFSVNITRMFQNQSNSSDANLCWPTSSLTRSDVYRMFVVSFYLQLFLKF